MKKESKLLKAVSYLMLVYYACGVGVLMALVQTYIYLYFKSLI